MRHGGSGRALPSHASLCPCNPASLPLCLSAGLPNQDSRRRQVCSLQVIAGGQGRHAMLHLLCMPASGMPYSSPLAHTCGLPASTQDNANIFITNIGSLTGLVDKYISQIDQQASHRQCPCADSPLLAQTCQERPPHASKGDVLMRGVIKCVLGLQVERIETEKLRAVGLRNRVATLEEVRQRFSQCLNSHPATEPAHQSRPGSMVYVPGCAVCRKGG